MPVYFTSRQINHQVLYDCVSLSSILFVLTFLLPAIIFLFFFFYFPLFPITCIYIFLYNLSFNRNALTLIICYGNVLQREPPALDGFKQGVDRFEGNVIST